MIPRSERCCAIDESGRRCSARATREIVDYASFVRDMCRTKPVRPDMCHIFWVCDCCGSGINYAISDKPIPHERKRKVKP